ncbi:FAD-binding domain-containing protein [Poronia punctata]|nr:FAD-binding domain-containing protein [Poronia punctata]
MASDPSAAIAALEQHLAGQQPPLPLIKPSNADFEATRLCYVRRDTVPSAIARPQNAEHVQALVRYCTEKGVDFVVRGGGHDCAGRSQVHDALSIDMRDIKHVHVSEDKKTAAVGGGILFRDLAKELDARGLVTPMGSVASVGYVGWATLGGYGPFSTSHGLGVDQIVGAKVVNAKGELVEAGEELLQGIRGGGGIFGVIVELTIKVYPLKELLVSLLVFDSSDLKATWTSYAEGYEKLVAEQPLPRALQLQMFGIELPGLGKVMAVGATWADADHEEGKRWINKIAALGKCLLNNPEPQSVSKYIAFNESLLVYGSYGRCYTLNLGKKTQRTAEVLAKFTESIPGGAVAVSVHALRAPAPSEEAVFGARVEHIMLELVCTTPVAEIAPKAADLARATIQELKETDAENVLESSYVSLLGEEDSDYRKIYGSHYDKLVQLKKKYDPDNVFKYAVPQLSV